MLMMLTTHLTTATSICCKSSQVWEVSSCTLSHGGMGLSTFVCADWLVTSFQLGQQAVLNHNFSLYGAEQLTLSPFPALTHTAYVLHLHGLLCIWRARASKLCFTAVLCLT
jgi:hypothetical protein